MKTRLLVVALLLMSISNYGQKRKLVVYEHVKLPADTLLNKRLLTSLDDFLLAAQKPNEENQLIFPTEKVETFIQLDEIKGIEKVSNQDILFEPYLTSVVPIEGNNYLVKVSYTGIKDSIPLTSGSFEFIAHKTDNSFLFSSPLKRNTKNWKAVTIRNNVFHYQTTINQTKLKEFDKLATTFDSKLKAINKRCEFYLCTEFVESQKLLGVEYKLIYNGLSLNTLSSTFKDTKIIVSGTNNATFDKFDPHDLWHDRLSLVISRRKVNRPIDEGIAYLFGGSWGISWEEILKRFKAKVADDKNANWIDLKENPKNFGESQAEPLMADYVVDALLVKWIEREKGFAGVWEFLNCGPYEKGNENFYKALEKLTAITKANYNEKVWELINREK